MGRHIYVHIPFCESKCPYCSFYSEAGSSRMSEYFEALIKEIDGEMLQAEDDPFMCDTVYFGGGTPSVPDEALICKVLSLIISKYHIDPASSEITIEVNPHSFSYAKGLAYKKAGFNRISMGIQSLHDDCLRTLGRLHDRKRALEALKEAREAGFGNLSGDLIIGVPGQSLEDVLSDADALIESGVTHISTYSLSIEEGTVFMKRYGDTLDDPDIQEEERRIYHALREHLKSSGFIPYEISNSAREGFRSRHNDSYWRAVEYYGFGAGSHGYIKGQRYGHEDNIDAYISEPLRKNVEEVLTEEDKMTEYAMLMLRTEDGITNEGFRRRFAMDIPVTIREKMDSLVQKKLCERTDDGIRLSRYGLDYANIAFMEFL